MRERRRPLVRLVLAALALVALGGCGGETTEETGILLTVKTTLGVPADLDQLTLEVFDARTGESVGSESRRPDNAGATPAHRPVWVVAVVAGTAGGYPDGVDLVVRGSLQGSEVGTTGAHKEFTADQVVRQTVNLDAGVALPEVVATAPEDEATGVDVETVVAVRFSEAMEVGPADDLDAAFSLSPTDDPGAVLTGTLAVNEDATEAAFVPSAPLAEETEYTALLRAWDDGGDEHLVSVADGLPLARSYRWTFTTARTLAVTGTDPAADATDVPVEQIVTVTFDRELDPATVSAASVGLVDDQGAVSGTVTYDAGTRTVSFTPAATLRELAQHTVTVTTAVTGSDGSTFGANLSFDFTTAGEPPAVATTDPADQATDVAPNVVLAVTFTEGIDEDSLTGAVSVVQDAGDGDEAVTGTGEYDAETFTARFRPDGFFAIGATVTATLSTDITDLSGLHLEEVFTLTFTVGDGPAVEATVPAPDAVGVTPGTAVTATFTRDMDPSSLDGDSFTLSCGGGAVTGAVSYAAGTRTATFTPAAPLPEYAECQATLTTAVRDEGGVPLLAEYAWSFTTLGQPPEVVRTTPAHRAFEVPVGTRTVTIEFSEALDPATVVAEQIRVSDHGDSRAGAPTWSAADNTVTLTFGEDLEAGRLYWIEVGPGVTDVAGLPLAAPYFGVFYTREAPQVAYVLPQNMSTEASTRSLIAVGFNVPMNGDSFELTTDIDDLKTFTVIQDDGVVVRGSLSYFDAPRAAVFQVLGNLLPHTRYTVILLGSAIRDDEGTPLGQIQAYTFVTGDGVDTTAPTVALTVPAAGAGDVAVDEVLYAFFSEPMEPITVSGGNLALTPSSGGAAVAATVRLVNSAVAMLFPDAELTRGTDYTLTLSDRLRDLSGNTLAAPVEVSFTTEDADTAPPSLIGTMPDLSAADVPTNQAAALLFDEPVDGGTVFLTAQAGTAPVSGNVRVGYGNRAVFFEPDGSWPAGKHITVFVAAGLADLQGNAHADEFTAVYFDTGAATDTTAPEIVASEPADDATEVAADATISLTFSEQLDLGAFDPFGLDLLQVSSGARVPYLAQYDPGTLRLELFPEVHLAGGEQYRVEVPAETRDLAGNRIAQGQGKSFILFHVDSVSPQVETTGPAAEGVLTGGSPLVARFDEPIEPASLTSTSFTVRPEGGTMDDMIIGAVAYTEATQTAILQPALGLPPGRYTALLSRQILDLAGNRLANNVPAGYEWSFTVVAGGLWVVDVDPEPGGLLGLDDFQHPVRITFNKQLMDVDLSGLVWVEEAEGGLPVDGEPVYLSSEQTVEFTPTSDWQTGTRYEVHVSAALEALDGESLGTPFVSDFTTVLVLFWDNLESGQGDWHSQPSASNAWKLVPDSILQPDNEVWALKGRDPGSTEYVRPCGMAPEDETITLISPVITVPAGMKNVFVYFLHRYDIEDSDHAELNQITRGSGGPGRRSLIPAFHGNNRQYEEGGVQLVGLSEAGGDDTEVELEFLFFVDGQRSGAGGDCDPTGLGWHLDDVVVFGY